VTGGRVDRGSGAGAARATRLTRGAIGIIALLGAAQLALWAGRVSPDLFPLPSAVLGSAVDLVTSGGFLVSVGQTMTSWAEAMAIAVAIAIPAGLLLGTLRVLESVLAPVLEFLRPFPAVVLIPFVLLVVQDDHRTEVLIVGYAAVWPVLINTIYGVRNVDPLAVETLRSFGFSWLAVARRVSLPSAAPFAATGVRIAASLAFVVAVAVELVGTGMNGIGAYTAASESATGDMATLIAVAVWSGLIGLVLNGAAIAVERRAFRWHFIQNDSAGAAL
jgi:NitT/TauT family transport system permease protein